MRLVSSRSRVGKPSRRGSRRLAVIVAVLLTCVVPAAVAVKPIPLDWKHMVGDPSVMKASKKYVVIATGDKVARGLSKDGKVWKWKGSALTSLPTWARAGDIWAADLAKVGGHYLLYFAAPVRGKTASSRCIGVATASSPSRPFTPIAGPPLVCPTWSGLGASDRVLDPAAVAQYNADVAEFTQRKAACKATATPTPTPTPTPTDTATDVPTDTPPQYTPPTVLPGQPTCVIPPKPSTPQTAPNVIGAIDPSLFVDSNHQPYLLYKTDGIPSSIRVLPLSADGMHPAAVTSQTAPQAASRPIVDSTGVLENPVVVKHGSLYYLFDSQGDYARCSYQTVWRSSTSLTDWSASPPHVLLARKNTHKLCGPGGADVLPLPHKTLIYFEAWTCSRSWKPCGHKFWAYSRKWERKHPERALYGARLTFPAGVPHVRNYLKGSKH